ncbi:hypothetical protein J2W22_003589 [Sphingomonas kyeonggiensis]|uniref:HTH domain-containing protein n=1 Tax=Sphingomonas kyeonggiensis TaxID=1268553 RepID=UPI00277FDB85|nr:HTH domain-containing protein [Sphingomonas kyeonggiensis]MDQ0251501.1 hypothetical protein [Sphingomonas kyeonggiensis]
MDTYLTLAERILAEQKRALSALEIIRIAYREEIAPAHLTGRTQHKTLQARLSEDILRFRAGSKFYRTAPGKFFLHALKDDPSVPEGDRRPMIARRRKRDLPKHRALAFTKPIIADAAAPGGEVSMESFIGLIKQGCYHYAASSKRLSKDEVLVWSFGVVLKAGHVLTYRAGPYREQRDSFMSKRVIGFYSPVVENDLTLFDQADHGVLWSGVKALASDLDLYEDDAWRALNANSKLQAVVYPDQQGEEASLLAVVSFLCPEWYEPTSSRLAINDLEWLDLRSPMNHLEDFDPWSRTLLPVARRLALGG